MWTIPLQREQGALRRSGGVAGGSQFFTRHRLQMPSAMSAGGFG
jgi:hypothetical protein